MTWNADGTQAIYTLLAARPLTVIVDARHRTARTLDLANSCYGQQCVASSWLTGTNRLSRMSQSA